MAKEPPVVNPGYFTGGITGDTLGGSTTTTPPPPTDPLDLNFSGPGFTAAFWNWLLGAVTTDTYMNAVNDPTLAQQYYDTFVAMGEPEAEASGFAESDQSLFTSGRQDIIDAITAAFQNIFTDAEIAEIVAAVIEPVLLGEASDNDILRLIRDTDVYKTKFPGFIDSIQVHPGMTEADYLQTRDQAATVYEHYFGKTLSTQQFGQLWAGDTSVAEFERRLKIGKDIADMGGEVKRLFQEESGQNLTDENLYEFMSNEIATPEFDRIYQDAYYKGWLVNQGIDRKVTDEMVKSIRDQGLSMEQVMGSYEQLRASLPALDRLAGLDAGIGKDKENPYNTFTQAFRAFVNADPEQRLAIGQAFARETARWTSQGGAATDQSGRALGLLSPTQRQLLGR